MRTLAIECATEACSIALFDGDIAGPADFYPALLASDHRILGRGHAERLIPMIAALPDKGKAQQILVSRGPGSFTGVRIGIAAARALGLAWQAEVLGYPTLALVAAMARAEHGKQPASAAMTGGHGQWFVQNFAADGAAQSELASLPPPQAVHAARHDLVAGTQAAALVALRSHRDQQGIAMVCHPDARFVTGLPHSCFSASSNAIYGRPPDAKVPL